MTKDASVEFHPVRVFGTSLGLWVKNFIPIVAIHGVNVFAGRVLQLSVRCVSPLPPGRPGVLLTVLLGIEVVAVIVLSAFISLFVLGYLKNAHGRRPLFTEVFRQTCSRFGGYLCGVFALLAFFVVGISLSGAFLMAGHILYAQHPATPLALGALLTTSTIAVALAIAVVWYGFYFTLAPLIAGFENKPVFQAFRESRSRIRGQALRYASAFLIFVVFYLALGLGAYFVLRGAVVAPRVLYAIDPAMGALFGPLWLALWLVSYDRVGELKRLRGQAASG
ncbi:MAG: hypothetical protein WC409_06140 [Candidatus Omnitrophota bacterium]|jgi:hypothetical protein